MDSFSPLLLLLLVWLLVGLPVSKLSKALKKSVSQAGKQGTPKGVPQGSAPRSEPVPEAEPARFTVMQPSVSLTGHDDSIYRGSLNAVTGEGYDPCHEEQLAPLTAAEELPAAEQPASPGLQLNWTGSEIVRGLVISEVLKRK